MNQSFNWYRCDNLSFVALVNKACQSVKVARGVSAGDVATRRDAVAVILAALGAGGPSGLPVPISKSNQQLFIGRYPKGYTRALDDLLEAGLVVEVTKGTRSKHQRDQDDQRVGPVSSTYGLTEAAWAVLGGNDFPLESFVRQAAAVVSLNVRNGKAKLKQSKPIAQADLAPMVEQLNAYNKALSGFSFNIGAKAVPWHVFELHRVFNSEDLLQGGRYYSDFVRLGKIERETLTVDGAGVISADFEAMHPRLALAIVGITPTGDPYRLGDGPMTDKDRRNIKRVFNAMLNVESRTGHSSEVDAEVKANSGDPVAIRAAILRRFPELKQLVGQGVGTRLQRADAEVVSSMIHTFVSAGRPLLPVHDGFYLLAQDKLLFIQALEAALARLWQVINQSWPEALRAELPMAWSDT